MATAAVTEPIPSWRDSRAMQEGVARLRALKEAARRAAETNPSRLAAARVAVRAAEQARATAHARKLVAPTMDLAGADQQLQDALWEVQSLEREGDTHERAIVMLEREEISAAVADAVRAQAKATDDRIRRLVPTLVALVRELRGVNRQLGEIDAQVRADFDLHQPAVALANVQPRYSGLALPISDRDIAGWLAKVSAAGL